MKCLAHCLASAYVVDVCERASISAVHACSFCIRRFSMLVGRALDQYGNITIGCDSHVPRYHLQLYTSHCKCHIRDSVKNVLGSSPNKYLTKRIKKQEVS